MRYLKFILAGLGITGLVIWANTAVTTYGATPDSPIIRTYPLDSLLGLWAGIVLLLAGIALGVVQYVKPG
jgi:hypothetical protein